MATFNHSNTRESSLLFAESSQLVPADARLHPESVYRHSVAPIVAQARRRNVSVLAFDTGILAKDQDVTSNIDEFALSSKYERSPRVSHTTIHVRQEWEGYVIEISSRDFTASLIDITAGDSFDQDCAIIPLSAISEADRKSLQIGKIFRWIIGYERSQNGERRRVSRIHFRDIRLTSRDLERGEKWADDILAWIENTSATKDANNDD